MRSFTTSVIVALALFLLATRSSMAFQFSRSYVATHHHGLKSIATSRQAAILTSRMAYSDDNSNTKPEYSRELMLREEAESPFRKVRFFLYISLGAGALTSFLISLARIAAALIADINTDLLPESLTNAGIDIAGMVVLSFLYQRDLLAQESRLKRASKGAELAKLKVYASKSIMQRMDSDEVPSGAEVGDTATFVTSLASLRRGRGIEKRVVIVAGGKSKIEQVMKQAKDLDSYLELNDLLIVPIILPQCTAPNIATNELPQSVALPVTGLSGVGWNSFVKDEAKEAMDQGIDVESDGFCVVLKKNGRIGQRTKGINLSNMVGEVQARRDAGMDVTNI